MMKELHFLVVDDNQAICRVLENILLTSFDNCVVKCAFCGQEALKLIEQQTFDLVLCDIKMPSPDGFEVLLESRKTHPYLPFIMLSGHGDIKKAVECIRSGAFHYFEKPPDMKSLIGAIKEALDSRAMRPKDKTLDELKGTSKIIGSSLEIKKLRALIEKVAPTNARVLICGESGTGKELVAEAIHLCSRRKDAPFIQLNCAAIPSELIESELFGHEKGAFTSAVGQRIGKFEMAHSGTLFLDEIGDMSLSAQAKVLRVLQENNLTRIGGDRQISVDVRIIAATNKNLTQEIEKGNFREDLYHRLAVIEIESPSLDKRKDDIEELVSFFASKIAVKENLEKIPTFSQKVIEELKQKTWKGNVRELQNFVERLIILNLDSTNQINEIN